MKIAFYSNYLNHHQQPLCDALIKSQDVEFYFVATIPIEQERLNMGYEDLNNKDYVIRAYEEDGRKEALELAKTCDVMIFGAAPLEFLHVRMQENKLTFYFTERPLKKGYYRRFIPTTRRKIKKAFIQYKDKPLYVLCASAYTSYDLKLCGFDENKCFTWGYFPKIENREITELLNLKSQNDKIGILYAGRLIKLKRTIDNLRAINKLVKKGITNFRFTIIGDGDQKPVIEKYISKNNLSNYVRLLPFMPTEQVREYMEKSDIYVFNSDFREGWGAVVNEAMNSACAVVASHAAGSVPFLIENGKNGIIYQCGNITQIANSLEKLITDTEYRKGLGKSAYEFVTKSWTSNMAVEKFLQLCENILGNQEQKIKGGVCSLATPLKNNWINKKR